MKAMTSEGLTCSNMCRRTSDMRRHCDSAVRTDTRPLSAQKRLISMPYFLSA